MKDSIGTPKYNLQITMDNKESIRSESPHLLEIINQLEQPKHVTDKGYLLDSHIAELPLKEATMSPSHHESELMDLYSDIQNGPPVRGRFMCPHIHSEGNIHHIWVIPENKRIFLSDIE